MILSRHIRYTNQQKSLHKNSIFYFGVFTLAVSSLISSPITASENDVDRKIDIWHGELKEIQAKIAEFQQMAAIEGISVGIASKDKSPITFSIGYANSETKQVVDKDTIFQAASLSKPILAFIVLKMVERGDIGLDTPLYNILENSRIEKKEWARLITPRLVLSHQTGLPNWGGDNLKFNFKPGTSFNYSGEGYVYLQNALETLTGLSYQELATREVFKPLNMTNSYFTWSDNQNLKLALGHDRAGIQKIVPIPESNAAASLHTTAYDYLTFISAWFNNNHINQELRDIAFTPATKSGLGKPDITTISWGLGWGLNHASDSTIAWHWGDNRIFRGFVLLDPKSQRAMVYFTNSENGLAISKLMTDLFFPGNPSINDWLGYGQADSDLWQAERLGYVYASDGDYVNAIKKFKRVLNAFPENKRIKSKIDWIRPLAEKSPSSIKLTNGYLERVTGQYGDRRLFLETGQLKYQRGEGQAHTLTPLYDQLFKVGDLGFFRLEIVIDKDGNAEKLIGHYEGGGQDESSRSTAR